MYSHVISYSLIFITLYINHFISYKIVNYYICGKLHIDGSASKPPISFFLRKWDFCLYIAHFILHKITKPRIKIFIVSCPICWYQEQA